MKRLAEESHSIREKNRILSTSNIKWENLPKKVFIVHKEVDLDFIKERLEELLKWLFEHWQSHSSSLDLIGIYPSILKDEIILNYKQIQFYDASSLIPNDIELVITLGGDGTVLHAAWLFQEDAPPIVPFHFGTLGFLTIFNWETFSSRMTSILTSGSRFNTRLRLNCEIHKSKSEEIITYNVLNEIVVERGASPFMSILDFYGDDKYLTKIQADGVAIATPTGSTAYSLSAGGSVVHPDVNAILVTPICPHSLSFRPLIVPENLELKIIVSESNRGNVWVSLDGKSRIELEAGDFLIVRPSSSPVITLCRDNQTSDWFYSLSQCLHWNKR